MILDPIFQRVDESIANATRGASRLAIVATLALLALGFATAAAHAYATRTWGEIAGNLVLAGAFLFAALIVYLATKDSVPPETQTRTAELEQSSFAQLPFVDQLFKPDGNLMRSIGSSIGSMAPVAAKAVAERVAPNLHLIIGAAVGLMIASKISEKLDSTKSPEA
ncbi:hypothetical protein [Methylocystis sp.]|jgi:hypothetical protein|uniref:hypothetical protein n=1 Tax=Methylocystis sp. TaxID=1911079 RepID=UPI003DA62881